MTGGSTYEGLAQNNKVYRGDVLWLAYERCRENGGACEPEQYAYRQGRSADDTISDSELLKSVARRISDKQILRIIKMWLTAPVEEVDERGNSIRRCYSPKSGRSYIGTRSRAKA